MALQLNRFWWPCKALTPASPADRSNWRVAHYKSLLHYIMQEAELHALTKPGCERFQDLSKMPPNSSTPRDRLRCGTAKRSGDLEPCCSMPPPLPTPCLHATRFLCLLASVRTCACLHEGGRWCLTSIFAGSFVHLAQTLTVSYDLRL